MKDTVYGPKFRQLRKEQNITLEQAAKGITSRSTLSLWENGNDNLSFLKVLTLLQKINIQPIEFFENFISPELRDITKKINKLYITNNIQKLRKYAIDQLKLANNYPQNKILFLEACYICNFYQDLTNMNLLSDSEYTRLKNIFSNISNWSYENVYFFGNTSGLLSSTIIYRLTLSLINYSINEKLNTQRWYDEIIDAVSNSIAILLKKDYKLAIPLIKKFDQMPVSDRFAFEKIHIRYFRAVINYIQTKNDHAVQTIIEDCNFLDLKELEDGFTNDFKQIKRIYGN